MEWVSRPQGLGFGVAGLACRSGDGSQKWVWSAMRRAVKANEAAKPPAHPLENLYSAFKKVGMRFSQCSIKAVVTYDKCAKQVESSKGSFVEKTQKPSS